jgi:integral membrane protein (TIGR01906 family)
LENKTVLSIIRWLVILAMPFFLGLGAIRAIIAWDYPAFEYGRIPPDQYGFTPEQRLDLAHGTLAYLQRPEPAGEVIYMLEDLRLPGTDRPLYNPDEISHMIDVKNVADVMKWIAYGAGAIVAVGLAILLIPRATRPFGWRTLFLAGLATVLILAAIALIILIAWPIFFVQFHELLFPPGTWTFAYTDSLIRLFPEQFWFDIGVLISVSTLALGSLVALIGYLMSRRSARQSVSTSPRATG